MRKLRQSHRDRGIGWFLGFVGLVILIGMPERRVGRITERLNALTAKDWETKGLGYPSVAWRGGDR